MLCEGRMMCGCADPYGQRPLGNARTRTVTELWQADAIGALRRDLSAWGSVFCGDCPLNLPLEPSAPPPQRPLEVGALPSRLFVECTAASNISCFGAYCAPETVITRTREAGMLDYDLFTRVPGCRTRSARARQPTCRSRSPRPHRRGATRSSSTWSARESTGSSRAARTRRQRRCWCGRSGASWQRPCP